MIIDTHAHVTSNNYDNIEQILKNSLSKNVKKIINCADDLETSNEVISLASQYKDILYPAVGFHPLNIDSLTDDSIDDLINLVKNNRIIAIGEIGLDYYYSKDNKIDQKSLFEKMLCIADEFNLPVIIHSREATLDTLNILKKYNLRGVIHCFSGSLETAREYIKLGYYIGVGGVVTFKNSNLKNVIKNIPLSRIVLETDSPYLSPEPFRGKKNEPMNVFYVAQFLADLFEIDLDDLINITTKNSKELFHI